MQTIATQTRRWKLFTFILIVGTIGSLFSCAPMSNRIAIDPDCTRNRYEYASIHMGSRCSIVLYASTEQHAAESARNAFDEIARIEDALSDYRSGSESMLAVARPQGTWVDASEDFLEALELSERFFELSNGAFDPTVGRFTHLWRRAKQESRIPTPEELADAAGSVGFEHVQIDRENRRVQFMRPGMILDFGAIGKGYAADSAMRVLRSHGLSIALVDVGGDISMGDPPPTTPHGWAVSVQPGNGAEWSTPLHSVSIATSGDLERHYEHNGTRYSHILDPRTGIGVTHRRAVTVIAHDGATADAVASIVSVLGEECIPTLNASFPGIRILIESGEPYQRNP